jgi:DNA-binding MarR family transcriptional regulator
MRKLSLARWLVTRDRDGHLTPKKEVSMARVVGRADPTLQSVLDASSIRGPENSVGFWLWRLSLMYQRQVEPVLEEAGLTHLQFLILVLAAWLQSSAPPVRQSDIVAISGVQAAQVSLMVKSLKAKKLLTQRTGKDDTRVRHIELTDAGIAALARATPAMGDLQRHLWPPGPETDAQSAQQPALSGLPVC